MAANVFRIRRGGRPIRGTAWAAPPSYFQSQLRENGEAHRRHHQQEGPPVPLYTEDINNMDAGYFDDNGIFHPNPNLHPPEVPVGGFPPPKATDPDSNIYPPQGAPVHDERTHGTVLRDMHNNTIPIATSGTVTPDVTGMNRTGGTGGASEVLPAGPSTTRTTTVTTQVHQIDDTNTNSPLNDNNTNFANTKSDAGEPLVTTLNTSSGTTTSEEEMDKESIQFKRPSHPPPGFMK
ncbi:hypothetical protein ACO0QE_001468 [Hanseniaspora vineae]